MLTGGHSHPAELSANALAAVLTDAGLRPVVETDLEAALAGLDESDHSLMVFNALRFTMEHQRYDEFRSEWAFSLSSTGRSALTRWVRSGRPLLALHSALVSFDDWPEWGDLIGGRWDWARSHHPPLGEVEIRCDPDHPVTTGLGTFTLFDECYLDLAVGDDNTVVATAHVPGADPQPACWLRAVDESRVAVSAPGHDLRSLDRVEHRALLARLVTWLLDPPPEETSA